MSLSFLPRVTQLMIPLSHGFTRIFPKNPVEKNSSISGYVNATLRYFFRDVRCGAINFGRSSAYSSSPSKSTMNFFTANKYYSMLVYNTYDTTGGAEGSGRADGSGGARRIPIICKLIFDPGLNSQNLMISFGIDTELLWW